MKAKLIAAVVVLTLGLIVFQFRQIGGGHPHCTAKLHLTDAQFAQVMADFSKTPMAKNLAELELQEGRPPAHWTQPLGIRLHPR